VDAVVAGIGEQTFSELVQALERGRDAAGIPGLAVPRSGELRWGPARPLPDDLDQLPLPNREVARRYRRRYRALGRPVGLINTARGCPFTCRFCAIIRQMHGRYLTKSPERVVSELATMPQRSAPWTCSRPATSAR
jgi:anaerobic magnesium-protoporphyrin IX monomethyl ester cyclase